MSPENRTMLEGLVDDIVSQLSAGIAEGRAIDPEKMKDMVDRGLYIDWEAVESGLVDTLEDYETLRERIRADLGGEDAGVDDPFVDLSAYARHGRKLASGPAVALVYIGGTIASGSYGDDAVSALDIAADINDAADDDGLEMIVVRIDSPGGSPVASETIRRALVRAKGRGKKVIVSMGDMAASGGYWVAAPADRIFALPATLTGSIGVAGGKFSLGGLWEKVGVNWENVQYGRNAGMLSPHESFSPGEKALINKSLDAVYEGFVARVAEGRNMTPAQIDAVARGRVWSGRQALANGLVDELGGLDAALDYAARALGEEDRMSLGVVVMPRPLTPLEKLKEILGRSGSYSSAIGAIAAFYDSLVHAGEWTLRQPLAVR